MQAPILLISHSSPWQGSAAAACLDTLMTFAVFDQPVQLLLHGTGIVQLLKGQDGAAQGLKTSARLFGAFTLYGITEILVDTDSLAALGLSSEDLIAAADMETPDEPLSIRAVSRQELAALVAQSSTVFNF